MPLRQPLLALLGSLVLAVLFTWPVALHPLDSLVGHPGNDGWNHAWGFWWILDAVRSEGAFPLHTELLNHPDGGTLFFIDSWSAVLALPIAALLGVPAAYNAVLVFAFAWNVFGTWVLGSYVLRDPRLAWLPAIVFGSSAHLIGQAYNGISETVNAGWIALSTWALLRLMDRPTWGRAIALGVLLATCSLSNFYYGLFGILICVIAALHRAITEPRRTRWPRFVGTTLAGAGLYAVLVLPILRLLSASIDADDAMVNRDPIFVWESLLNHNVTDAVGFFRPGRVYSPDLKALYGEDLVIVTYLGWVCLALGAVALLRSRPRRQLTLWVTMAVVFLIFSLGPYLHVGGADVLVAERKVPLPFLTFFEAFPLFSRISHPFRFVVPALLSLSMLAGFGVQVLARRLPPLPTLAVACTAVLVEVLLLSPAPWPIPVSDARIPSVVADLRGEGAVLDLPMTVPNLERAVYTWYQTAHGHPSPYGLNDPIPDSLEGNPLTQLLVQVESSRALTLPRTLPELELVIGARRLEAQGYRWIVLHERLYPELKRQQVTAILDALFGEPARSDGVSVYTVGEG